MDVVVWATLEYAFGRELLRGVRAYTRGRTNWSIRNDYFPRNGRRKNASRADAVIAHIVSAEAWPEPATKRTPIVVIGAAKTIRPAPRVGFDEEAIGALGAAHLLDRNFRHLAFVGQTCRYPYCARRWSGFRAVCEKRHIPCEVFDRLDLRSPMLHKTGKVRISPEFKRWLAALPKPVGIMVENDDRAMGAVTACVELGLRVPEDVAVLGVDDDPLACELCETPLSSIRTPAADLGYAAAERLHALLEGRALPGGGKPLELPPVQVVTRASTDTIALGDAEIAEACVFIRRNAIRRPISVLDVVSVVPLGRRALERRFRAQMGRSILEEIRRTRVEHARRLLVETSLKQETIARDSGFSSATILGIAFRRATGMSPGDYRRQFRVR